MSERNDQPGQARATSAELLKQRSSIASSVAVAASLIGVAVLLVLLSIHFITSQQQGQLDKDRAKIASLEQQVAAAHDLESDVAVLKQQVIELHGTPKVPDRPPLDAPPTTTTTTVRRSTTTTSRPSPTTTGTQPSSTTTTTNHPNTTTTTSPPPSSPPTSCVVLGLICK